MEGCPKNHGEIGFILGTIQFQSCPQVLGNFLASWWGIETTIAHIPVWRSFPGFEPSNRGGSTSRKIKWNRKKTYLEMGKLNTRLAKASVTVSYH